MQKGIVLSQHQIDILVKHARDNSPNESCAILFGKVENDHFAVKDIFLTKNTENSPVNFTISNDELIKGYDEAEKRNLDVVGIFHSHPNSEAHPSPTDKKYMEINPVPWVIFSNQSEQFRAYVFESTIKSLDLIVQ
ncbi:MAG TPA: M67 family metallopeptidase [Nitrosopumilaceae archaeon]|nr:M67 family metallopeptidase [Nitrosopumilaceae archaeon]